MNIFYKTNKKSAKQKTVHIAQIVSSQRKEKWNKNMETILQIHFLSDFNKKKTSHNTNKNLKTI